MRIRLLTVVAASVLFASLASAQHSPPHYRLSALNLPGSAEENNNSVTLNNNGLLVTSVGIDGVGYGVTLDTLTGETHLFGPPTLSIQWVPGLNDGGVIVGKCDPGLPFMYRNGVAQLLPLIPGAVSGFAARINGFGLAAGGVWNGHYVPVVWDLNSGAITTLPAGTNAGGEAMDINSSGSVVGHVDEPGRSVAALWTQGTLTELPSMGGIWAAAGRINDAGAVLFDAADASGDGHAYLWVNGVVTQVAAGVPGPSSGVDMNQDGTIVGSAGYAPIVVLRGEVFFLGSQIVTPLPEGTILENPLAINNQGVIVARVHNWITLTRNLVLLTPTHCGSADFDHDGASGTDADVAAFFACMAGSCCPTCDSADFDGDGSVATDADIEAFFRVLSGGDC
jgi:uncharacterized membrane protein